MVLKSAVMSWLLLVCAAVLSADTQPPSSQLSMGPASPLPPSYANLDDLLGNGGHVLFIRHGSTDTSQPDQIPTDLHNCDNQRPLTDAGREQMREVGERLADKGWPIVEPIHVSVFCRTQESAQLLFPEYEHQVETELRYTAALTSADKQPVIQRTRELLSKPLDGPYNRVLVAHAPNIAELMDYYPAEAAVVVLTPLGNKDFKYVTTIGPDDWAALSSLSPAPDQTE